MVLQLSILADIPAERRKLWQMMISGGMPNKCGGLDRYHTKRLRRPRQTIRQAEHRNTVSGNRQDICVSLRTGEEAVPHVGVDFQRPRGSTASI